MTALPLNSPQRPATPLHLVRRWVQDYFDRHDDAAAREFIAPHYALEIGDHRFAGRDEQWLPAVAVQFSRFPGMGMTVHQVVPAADRVAVWFSEHGAQGGVGGQAAAWSGVAIYRAQDGVLVGCTAQEDYTTRARQLRSGVTDAMDPPAAAPWDTAALLPDAAAEAVVRQWLANSWPAQPASVRCDDDHLTGVPLAFEVKSLEVVDLFSSGSDVAFHVRQTGRYRGGLPGVPVRERDERLHCNGIVRVEGGAVCRGRVIRDRGGLRERLMKD